MLVCNLTCVEQRRVTGHLHGFRQAVNLQRHRQRTYRRGVDRHAASNEFLRLRGGKS
jgi:hypothetical protein